MSNRGCAAPSGPPPRGAPRRRAPRASMSGCSPGAGYDLSCDSGQLEVVEQSGPGLGVVAVGVAVRQVALVAPPEGDAAPVDAVACRGAVDRRQHRGTHRAAGEADVHLILHVEQVDDLGDEAGRDAPGERRLVRMNEHPSFVGHETFFPDPFTACAFSSAVRLLCRSVQQAEALLNDLTEEVVRVEPTQFLGETVAEVAAGERDRVGRLVRLHEGRDVVLTAGEVDRAGRAFEAHTVDAARERGIGRVELDGTSSCSRSHAASSSVDGESADPLTVTPVTGSYGG